MNNNNNNNNNEDTRSSIESATTEHETVVEIGEDIIKKPTFCANNCCRTILFLCVVVLLSFFTSIVTTKCLLNMSSTLSNVETRDPRTHDAQLTPLPEKQVQDRPIQQARVGAQLSIDQGHLKGSSPKIVWTHDGADNYLDGVNHVIQNHGNDQFDCLEATQDGHYLISIQLTYHYSDTSPRSMIKSYFTLTKFRNNEPYVIAKSDHVIPPRNQRVKTVTKQPVTMVRSDPLRQGDRLCVIVSKPKLIYASKIDNFFGMVAL